MHAGITAITELAVETGLTNRLPPDNAKQSFFLALSPLPKRRQFGFPRARKRESQHHVSSRKTLQSIALLTAFVSPYHSRPNGGASETTSTPYDLCAVGPDFFRHFT